MGKKGKTEEIYTKFYDANLRNEKILTECCPNKPFCYQNSEKNKQSYRSPRKKEPEILKKRAVELYLPAFSL